MSNSRQYCRECRRLVYPAQTDEGIGWYSFGSSRECHTDMVDVCPDCGEPIDPTARPCDDCEHRDRDRCDYCPIHDADPGE